MNDSEFRVRDHHPDDPTRAEIAVLMVLTVIITTGIVCMMPLMKASDINPMYGRSHSSF